MQLTGQFHALQIDKIGKAELAEFETKRRTDGVTPSTIRRDLACLSSILSSAEDWEWLDEGKNPVPAYMKRRKRRGLKEAAPKTRYLTDTEEERLLKVATGTLRNAIILAIDTGLRKEELLSLTWDRVNLERRFITTGTKTKSGRSRLVPLSDRACDVLAQIRAQQDAQASKLLAKQPDSEDPFTYVLSHQNGKRFVDFLKVFKAAATEALVYGVSWHDLRRTAGCRWLQDKGYSMEEVSMFLGHSSVTLTEKTYAFLEAEKSATRRTNSGTI